MHFTGWDVFEVFILKMGNRKWNWKKVGQYLQTGCGGLEIINFIHTLGHHNTLWFHFNSFNSTNEGSFLTLTERTCKRECFPVAFVAWFACLSVNLVVANEQATVLMLRFGHDSASLFPPLDDNRFYRCVLNLYASNLGFCILGPFDHMFQCLLTTSQGSYQQITQFL